MSMETINSVVNSFYQIGRIGDLDISGLYELIKQACIFNPFRGHILIYASSGMDQNIIGFRSYPKSNQSSLKIKINYKKKTKPKWQIIHVVISI